MTTAHTATRREKYDQYKTLWSLKKRAAIEKELESMRRWLNKHPDSFFQEAAPDELTDGLRICALKDALREIDEKALSLTGAA